MLEVLTDEGFDFEDGGIALDDGVLKDGLELAVQGLHQSVYHVRLAEERAL